MNDLRERWRPNGGYEGMVYQRLAFSTVGCACKRGRPCLLLLARPSEGAGCEDDKGIE